MVLPYVVNIIVDFNIFYNTNILYYIEKVGQVYIWKKITLIMTINITCTIFLSVKILLIKIIPQYLWNGSSEIEVQKNRYIKNVVIDDDKFMNYIIIVFKWNQNQCCLL